MASLGMLLFFPFSLGTSQLNGKYYQTEKNLRFLFKIRGFIPPWAFFDSSKVRKIETVA